MLLQLLIQQQQLVVGILSDRSADRLQAFLEQCQFLQLDRQLAARLACCLPQLFHADAGAFQFI